MCSLCVGYTEHWSLSVTEKDAVYYSPRKFDGDEALSPSEPGKCWCVFTSSLWSQGCEVCTGRTCRMELREVQEGGLEAWEEIMSGRAGDGALICRGQGRSCRWPLRMRMYLPDHWNWRAGAQQKDCRAHTGTQGEKELTLAITGPERAQPPNQVGTILPRYLSWDQGFLLLRAAVLVSSGECREFCLRVDSSHAGQREDSPYHGINFKEEWKRIMHGNLFTFCVVLVQHIGCV